VGLFAFVIFAGSFAMMYVSIVMSLCQRTSCQEILPDFALKKQNYQRLSLCTCLFKTSIRVSMLTASFLQNLQQHLYKESEKLCLKVCLKVCIKFVSMVESLLQVLQQTFDHG